MKRTFSLALALLMLVGTVSCGGEAVGSDETTVGDTSSSDTTTAASEYVPEAQDFGGYEFKMIVPPDGQGYEYFDAGEASGDVVNDAVFETQQNVMELYNITLSYTPMGTWASQRDALMTLIRSSILADDDSFDVAYPMYWYGQQLVVEGNFIDLNTLEGLHLDEEWWVKGYNNQAQFNGKLYSAVGDYGIRDLTAQMPIYFNKRMYEEYGYDNIYDIVREGKWTLDKLIELSTGVGKDLNGDSVVNMEDQLGYFCQVNGIRAFTVNCGVKFADFDKSGMPYVSLSSEKTYDIYDKVFNFINKTDDALYENATEADIIKTFTDGRLLFLNYTLAISSKMRGMDDDFGIIPMPKYDEAQENYVTYTSGPQIAVIPRTADDPERTAVILDALNYYANKLVVPAYHEVAMKSKYARDNDTAEMLDLIKDSVFYDFGFINGTILDNLPDMLGGAIANGVENFASEFAASKNAYDAAMEKLIEDYKALD